MPIFGASVWALCHGDADRLAGILAESGTELPRLSPAPRRLQPILSVIPLQIFTHPLRWREGSTRISMSLMILVKWQRPSNIRSDLTRRRQLDPVVYSGIKGSVK